jgi:hypothetical protein
MPIDLKLFFKKTFFVTLFWTVIEPLIYLGAFGFGFGRYVPPIEGLPFIDFYYPGLLCSTAMMVAVDKEFGAGKVDAIHPSASIVAENPVAIVERTVAKKGTATEAKAYLDFLYSDEGQEIAAKHNIRPRNEAILKKYSNALRPIKLFTVNEYFGSLAEAQKVHFNDGGQFDKLYTAGK